MTSSGEALGVIEKTSNLVTRVEERGRHTNQRSLLAEADLHVAAIEHLARAGLIPVHVYADDGRVVVGRREQAKAQCREPLAKIAGKRHGETLDPVDSDA